MDLEGEPPLVSAVMATHCCECGCTHCSAKDHSTTSSSSTWLRSVKRKIGEFEEGSYRLVIPDFNFPQVAKVELGNECVALREMVSNQQKAIDDLLVELEEERNASSSATDEAMSMILRLQTEKAEIEMESRQFKRFVEEKTAQDQKELLDMEDLLFKREQTIQSLTCEVQAYKHRMMSYGLSEAEAEGAVMSRSCGLETPPIPTATENTINNNFVGIEPMASNTSKGFAGLSRSNSVVENMDVLYEFPMHEYPPLKCNVNENLQAYTEETDDETIDIEKYAFGEIPQSRDHIKDLEYRINQLENTPRENSESGDLFGTTKSVYEKVIVGHSPKQQRPKHFSRISTDSTSSFCATFKEMGSLDGSPKVVRTTHTAKKMENNKTEDASEMGDDTSDRIYTIDPVHMGVPYRNESKASADVVFDQDFMSTPRESLVQEDTRDPEFKKLYMRLQSLEADRESMRQTLISMRKDKAQLVLLKEIAQHLCNEMSPARNMPVKKRSIIRVFSFFSVFKWVLSIFFWRRRARRSKYMFGRNANNVGLLMLLDKGPHFSNWRCLSSTEV